MRSKKRRSDMGEVAALFIAALLLGALACVLPGDPRTKAGERRVKDSKRA